MPLFLLLALPLFSLGVTTYYNRDRFAITLPLMTFLKGIICFFIALLFYLIIRSFFPLSYTAGGLYVFHLVNDHLLYFILALGGLFLFKGIPDAYNQKENVFESFVFLSGFYSMVAFMDFVENLGKYDIFILFFLPLLRISTILCGTIFLVQFINDTTYLRFGFLAGLIFLPFVLTFTTIFFLHKLIFIALACVVLLFAASVFLFYIFKDR
jgi:hypothetical protein